MSLLGPVAKGRVPFCLLLAVAGLVGCGRDVEVYKVPKETAPAQNVALPPGHPDMPTPGAPGLPTLTWTLPANWEQTAAGEMRVASFRVKGGGDKSADVSIIPLPGMAGGDLSNVNRWRGQVGQPPISEEELAKAGQSVQVDGQTAKVYEQAGEAPGSGDKTRILAGILRRDGVAWFFKMTGDDELVAGQKAAFIAFVSSVKFAAAGQPELPASHPPMASASQPMGGEPAAGTANTPEWQVPSGWQRAAAGQFLAAKFLIAGEQNAQAAVNVSVSAGDGGGWVGNVNRWRKQLGLSDQGEAELKEQTTSLETAGGSASVVDISGADARTGQKARLIGAMLSRGQQTWFYKLMGSEQLVEREKEAFTQFLKTAKYPNAS